MRQPTIEQLQNCIASWRAFADIISAYDPHRAREVRQCAEDLETLIDRLYHERRWLSMTMIKLEKGDYINTEALTIMYKLADDDGYRVYCVVGKVNL